jgi:hypothetical protein
VEFIAARQSGVESRFLSIPRRQESFKDVVLPTFLEGVRINTSAADAQAITVGGRRRLPCLAWRLVAS